MYGEGRMLGRWGHRFNVMIVILILHNEPTTSQCPSELSCNSIEDCHLIFSQGNRYHNARSISEMKARSSDECYTFTMKDKGLESCSDTNTECIGQGGTIVNITNSEQYKGVMDEILHILSASKEATFNVLQNIETGEQCAFVKIEDGWIWNSDKIIPKHTDANSTVNAILCVLTDISIFPSTISTLTPTFGSQTMDHLTSNQISNITSITPEQNQQRGKADKMVTPIVIVVVSGIVFLLLVFVGFAYFKIKKRNINSKRTQKTLGTTTNACKYSNHDLYYDVSQTNVNNDDSEKRKKGNVTPDDNYTYAATELKSVTSQPELQDTIGRNYEQPLLEDEMYDNVQTDAVVETGDCEYGKLNRSRAVTSAGDHDDTYNSFNEDVSGKGHYDGLRNVTSDDTYTYAATELKSVTSQRELQDTIGRNYEQSLMEDEMYANVQTDAAVERGDCEYDKLNRSGAVTSAGDHDDTYNSLNEDVICDKGQYDGLRRINAPTDRPSFNQYEAIDQST